MTDAENDMGGPAMAAYVVMSLDEDTASQVLRNMDESAIGALTDAMAKMRGLPNDVASQIYARLMTDLETAGATSPGGFASFRNLLSKAFGDKRANDMLERIMRSNSSNIDVLTKVDPKSLADQIKDERPQLIAVLLGQMTRSAAVDCLNAFHEDLATDVVLRYARLDTVKSFALVELKSMLSELLGGHVGTRASSMGGVRQAADLLNGMGGGASDRTLSRIRDSDPTLAAQIRENMFTFDDLLNIADQALQLVIREVDAEKRAPALRGASPQMRDWFLGNIAKKEADILKDDIENGPMVTRADAQAAQREFVEAAVRLAEEGRISIRGDEDML